MPIEGYIVEALGMLWMVKGCYQPPQYVIALPRYGYGGSRIHSLLSSLSIAAELGCIAVDSCLKRAVPVIPRAAILRVLNPLDAVSRSALDARAREFIEIIACESGLDTSDIGITGSYLAKTVVRSIVPRDLDIIVYGEEAGARLYRALSKLRREGITEPASAKQFKPGSMNVESWLRLARRRVLEGVYKDLEYSVRAVRCVEEEPCTSWIEVIGRTKLLIEITEHVSPFIMPYRYRARVLRIEKDPKGILREGMTIDITSQRMRFSEIPLGTKLRVETTLLFVDGEPVLDFDRPGTRVEVL